jgi:ubiquitin-activating enzyme E1
MSLKVLIVGMRGLGVEVAKNLILTGPARVDICDREMVKIEDLSANFYLTEEHVGKSRRDHACEEKLKSLNPNVEVKALNYFSGHSILNYDVIVFTENYHGYENMHKWNTFLRT